VALRRQNCGTTHYAIYQKPASQCSPPTAIPGRSRHERGLALDFNSKGKSLTASDFSWLKANAGRYGLKNLPSERWHWSTDGA
jgi:LAS superfamily LD-carboxypeptidase LdcB